MDGAEQHLETATAFQESENNTCKMQQQQRRGELVNGYFVYTRRKRTPHSENEEAKRLKTDNAEIKVENRVLFEKGGSDEAVQNDVVLWTSKRQRRPSFKLKVESEDASAASAISTASVEKAKAKAKKVVVNSKPLTCKELFDTGFLDGVPVVYVGCKKVSSSFISLISSTNIAFFILFFYVVDYIMLRARTIYVMLILYLLTEKLSYPFWDALIKVTNINMI